MSAALTDLFQDARASGDDWRHFAACADADPEVMFPLGEDDTDEASWTPLVVAQVQRAKAVCRACPVRSDCLAWALDTGQDAGVWGGLSSPERRVLRRERAVSDAPDPDG